MTFASDVQKWAEKAGLNMREIVRASCLEIGGEVIDRTPVDTGRAKNSWVFKLDSPDTITTRGPDSQGSDAIQNMESVVLKMGADILFVTNNLEYIGYLEFEKTSSQAPNGMVRVTVNRFKRIVAEKAKA